MKNGSLQVVQKYFFFLKMGEMSAYFWWRDTGYKSSQNILNGVGAESQGDTHSHPEDSKINGKAVAEQNPYPPLQRSELAHRTPEHFGSFQWILH